MIPTAHASKVAEALIPTESTEFSRFGLSESPQPCNIAAFILRSPAPYADWECLFTAVSKKLFPRVGRRGENMPNIYEYPA